MRHDIRKFSDYPTPTSNKYFSAYMGQAREELERSHAV